MDRRVFQHNVLVSLIASAAALGVQSLCLADEPLSEIVVTAQKRSERLQDVPMSISVLSGQELDASSMSSVTDALNEVPGVVASVGVQGGGTQISIRGVGASGPTFNGSSPIGYYLDSVPFGLIKTAIAPDEDAYDLQRVEVLRGPQGTLYGASAEGGLVRVLTNDADLNNFDVKARGTLSSTDGGGENYRGDMAINVPLIDGKLALRGVVGYENLSGWIDRPDENHANDAVLRNYRLKLNAQPTDELSIGLSAWNSRNNYGAPSAAADNGRSLGLSPEPITTDYDAYGVKVAYEFPQFVLSSATSYLDYANRGDLDLTSYGLKGFGLFTGLNSKVISQELTLNSTNTGSWRWTAGLFYRDANDRLLQTITGLFPAPIDYSDVSKSYAAFGEVGQRFWNDQLEWTLGLRNFYDHVSNQENVQDEGLTNVPLYHAKESFSATTPRAVMTWYPNRETTIYGSYSQGFRSGFPQNANIVQQDPQYVSVKPDKLNNYELGAKQTLWDNRLSFDTALYYIDWRNVQQTLSVPLNNVCCFTVVVNGQSASGVGLDLGVSLRPLEGLDFRIYFSWNNLSFDHPVLVGNIVIFNKGERLNYSSEYTGGGSASYLFPLGFAGLHGRLSASANYSSQQQDTIQQGSAAPPIISSGDSFLIARASFAIRSQNHWDATLFVDNAANASGRLPSTANTPDWYPRVRPRTAGVQFEYHLR